MAQSVGEVSLDIVAGKNNIGSVVKSSMNECQDAVNKGSSGISGALGKIGGVVGGVAKGVAVGIGVVSPAVIDEVNILQATYEAMRIAISKLQIRPDLLLNDAVTIPEVDIKQVGIVKGDARSVSIAAASIVAKVTRDRMMVEYDKIYPEYKFASNKGYGSKEHTAALKEIGPCAIHRASFIKNFV